MPVGFFRRLTSALVDFILIMVVVYLAFVLLGRGILRNRVDYFDQRYETYSEILTAYNNDVHDIQVEYEANIAIANGDADLEALATDNYNYQLALLDMQNSIDIEPYNESLTGYFLEIIYFFSIGFLLLITLVSVLTLGRTPGRRVMALQIISTTNTGEIKAPNTIQVFFHDVILRYFFIAIVFTISLYYGFLLILLTLIVDMILMTVTRNKTTIRDYFLRLRVVKASSGY